MLIEENEAVKEVDVLKKVLKVLEGIKKAPYVPMEEVESKGPVKKKPKKGAESYARYFCNEFFQKKKKSELKLEGQRVLDAIVDQGVEYEEQEGKKNKEGGGIDQEEVKKEGVHEDKLYIVEDQEHANDGKVQVDLNIKL